MDILIYVVLLQDNHYFIHHTSEKPQDQVLLEFEIYYDYPKIHKPICIIESVLEKNEIHLDNIVKDYMYNYGFAYVRGGSYSNIDLTLDQEAFILRELTESIRENVHTGSYDYIVNNYINRQWTSIEEIDTEYNKLASEFEKYQQELFERNKFQKVNGQKISYNIDFEIRKLYDFCKSRGCDYNNVTPEYVKLYNKLIPQIKHIIKKYSETCEKVPTKYLEYMYHFPHFYLDPFFYTYSFSPLPVHVDKIDHFFEAIQYFIDWSICHIQELEFDVNSYPYDIEWLYPRIFYIIDKIKSNMNHTMAVPDIENDTGVAV